MDAKFYIEKLGLIPHIEGGYFKETYACEVRYDNRNLATSIYFLLEKGNFSALHRLSADEMWFYHAGNPLTLEMIDLEGVRHTVTLGNDLGKGEVPFFTVPKKWIFGSFVEEGFALVSCVVTPGFTYEDFELLNRNDLVKLYPSHHNLIQQLTRVNQGEI